MARGAYVVMLISAATAFATRGASLMLATVIAVALLVFLAAIGRAIDRRFQPGRP